jgi:hypothetical protein
VAAAVAFMVGAAASLPSGARAQATKEEPSSDPAVVEAREHFNRAQALYDEGHPDAALLELRRAYALKPNVRLLYNIGEISFTAHDYVGSLRAFEQFLRESGTKLEPGKKAEAESRLVTLRALVGRARVVVDVDGATVTIDDEPIGTSPLARPASANAGRRRVAATKDGFVPALASVVVVGNEQTDVSLHLAPAFAAQKGAGAPEPASRFTTLTWVGLGSAVALGGGALAMGVASSSASNDLGNITYAGSEPSQEYKDKESAVSRDRTLAIVLGGAAAATLAATLFFTFTRPLPDKQASRSTVGVAIGPASLSLKGNF